MANSNLNCDEARELVASRELGIEVDGDQQDALDRHLAACEGCREALSEEQELSSLLQANLRRFADGAEALGDRIISELPDRVPVHRRSFPFSRLEAVAAVLLFGVGLFVGTLFTGDATLPGSGAGGSEQVTPTPVTVERPFLVGETGRIGHELLPRDRLKTTGVNKIILADPENPGVRLEIDMKKTFVDVPTGVEYR